MSEKKHIDRLFQEKFKDFEVSPKEKVWKNIEQKLAGKKSKKPVLFPLWQKIAGIAALLAIAFLIGNFVLNDVVEKKMVGSEEKALEKTGKNQTPSDAVLENDLNTKNAVAVGETNHETEVQHPVSEAENPGFSNQSDPNLGNQQIDETNDLTKIVSTKTQNAQQQMVSQKGVEKKSFKKNPSQQISKEKIRKLSTVENSAKVPFSPKNRVSVSKKTNGTPKKEGAFASITSETNLENEFEKAKKLSAEENKKSLVKVAATQKQKEEQSKKNLKPNLPETSKWQVKPFAAPVYSSGFGSENALDPSLAENNGEGEITFSYGINFSYKVSERLKIRSGISQVSMAYNVHDIAFISSIKPTVLNNVSYSSEAAQLEIISVPSSNNSPENEIFGKNPYTSGTLHQQLGFIEIPLEIEYALIDQKFGVSIIGGASTLFLNENNIAINSENGTTNIGEASNLNEASFSTNIGLGLDYEISDQFEINLEPMFKYQINTFDQNANGFKPYYFGIYTGIGFKF